jgi:hypothetical protein
MEYGPAKQRRRATAVPRPVNWPVHLVDSDTLEILIDFYHDTLLGGTLPFQHYHPRTLDGTERNLLAYSEDFTTSEWYAWDPGGATISADVTTGPDGVVSASKIVEGTSLGQHVLVVSRSDIANDETITFSGHCKQSDTDREVVDIQVGKRDNNFSKSSYDLDSGLVTVTGAGMTSGMAAAGDGYYRIYTTMSVGSGGYDPLFMFRVMHSDPPGGEDSHSYTGDGTSGVYVWGAQLELGALTDYKATTGAPTPKFLLRFTSAPTITPSGLGYWVELPLEIMP